MARRQKAGSFVIEARFWQHVEVLDAFWLKTFVEFTAPLKSFYVDPISAGAAILSRYQKKSHNVAIEIAIEPEKFGALEFSPRCSAKTISEQIVNPRSRVSLARCAALFSDARAASAALDQLRAEDPRAFETLQRQRAANRDRCELLRRR